VDKGLVHQRRQQLTRLCNLAQQGRIDLYFTDESSFSTRPSIPYGWLPIGQQASIRSDRPLAYNVLGFLSLHTNHLASYLSTKSANSEFMIRCFDDFVSNITKPTVVILDQASYHRSKLFKQRAKMWQQKGLFLVYLPPYCPQLNAIEILWRFMKYRWLKPRHYLNKDTLKNAIQQILAQYGQQYVIQWENFLELKV